MDGIRLDLAKANLQNYGYKVIETSNCRTNECGRSSKKEERAKQFNEVIKDDKVKAIICMAGGDFLLEMLPDVKFYAIKENYKWIQGYSDPTGILYAITTNLDIATIYGENFKSFAMRPFHKSLENNLKILEGKGIIQNSFEMYEDESIICS